MTCKRGALRFLSRNSWYVDSRCVAFLPTSIKSAPCSAKINAADLPIPEPPPDISITFSFRALW